MKELLQNTVTGKLHQHLRDVYFDEIYGRLYEEKEAASLETFKYQSENGEIKYMFLKRKVPCLIAGKQYYDIITPYGYGGPNILQVGNTKKLLEDFYEAFSEYCNEEKIVSEFIRFHLMENNEIVEDFYGETSFAGMNIVKDLRVPIMQDCGKSVGRSLKKAASNGLEVIYDTTGERLNDFLDVYYSTMNRNDAKEYYYFDEPFFERLNKELSGQYVYVHVLLGDKVVSSGLTIYGSKYSYGFLGGTLRDYYAYSPSILMEIQTMEWLQRRNVDYYILGGGYEKDDGIYRFKRNFAKKTGDVPFYVGKKIHNLEIYHQLVQQRSNKPNFDPNNSFFPLYRS